MDEFENILFIEGVAALVAACFGSIIFLGSDTSSGESMIFNWFFCWCFAMTLTVVGAPVVLAIFILYVIFSYACESKEENE